MGEKIAIVGTGLIGGAWAITFARGGQQVALWDAAEGAAEAAIEATGPLLEELEAKGLLKGQTASLVLARIASADSLEAAVDGAVHVQENASENVEVKRALFAELDRVAPPDVTLASSSTAIRPSLFTEGVPGRSRCLVAHPINPPYVIPAVEIVPAPWTDPAVVERARTLTQLPYFRRQSYFRSMG